MPGLHREVKSKNPTAMKTLNIVIATSLLSVALLSCQKEDIAPPPASSSLKSETPSEPSGAPHKYNYVVYEVNLIPSADQVPCGQYEIRILDATGKTVAAPQEYVYGVTSYQFVEFTTLTTGTRTAVLKSVPGPNGTMCESQLHAEADANFIQFGDEHTHYFDLMTSVDSPSPGR